MEALYISASVFTEALSGSYSPFSLVENYRKSLSEAFAMPIQKQGFTVHFEDSPVASRMLSFPSIKDNIQRILSVEEIEREQICLSISRAIESLYANIPGFRQIIELQVAHVVVARNTRHGSGTTSMCPAHIWLSPATNWTIFDYVECLYHEVIHLNLFLLDMVHGLYRDRLVLSDPDYYSRSSIKGVERPIDKSFHAMCVTNGLVELFKAYGRYEEAQALKDEVVLAMSEFLRLESGLSNMGKQILRQLQEKYTVDS